MFCQAIEGSEMGLERWLSSDETLLFFQRFQAYFSAFTFWDRGSKMPVATVPGHSVPSSGFLGHLHTHIYTICTQAHTQTHTHERTHAENKIMFFKIQKTLSYFMKYFQTKHLANGFLFNILYSKKL